jgi:hypothetical protein
MHQILLRRSRSTSSLSRVSTLRGRNRLCGTIRTPTRTQRSRNLSMCLPRRSLRHRNGSQPRADCSREGMLLRHGLRRCLSTPGRSRIQQSVRNRHRRFRRAPARRTLMVHNFLQTPMLKKYMLTSAQLICRLPKLIHHIQQRSLRPAILHTRIAISRHAQLQIQRPIFTHRETQVRSRHYIACSRSHLDLNRPTIQRQHQRSRGYTIDILARRYMQSACRAHLHRAAALQLNLSRPVPRRHRRIPHQHRSAITHFKRTRHCGVLQPHCPNLLLCRCKAVKSNGEQAHDRNRILHPHTLSIISHPPGQRTKPHMNSVLFAATPDRIPSRNRSLRFV